MLMARVVPAVGVRARAEGLSQASVDGVHLARVHLALALRAAVNGYPLHQIGILQMSQHLV